MKNPATAPDNQLNDFTQELLNRINESPVGCAWVELRNGMMPAIALEKGAHGSYFISTNSLYTDKHWTLSGKASNPLDFDLDMVSLSDA
jgi:hypothetical protein